MTVGFDHQVFSYQEVGGVSRYFSELYRGLPAFGWSPDLPLFRTPNRYLRSLDGGRFRPFLPRFGFKGKARLLEEINKAFVREAWKKTLPQVFHPTYFDPWFLPFVDQTPWVVTVHDMVHERFPDGLVDVARTSANKRLLVGKAPAVVAVSQATKDDLVTLLGVDQGRVMVIPHGLSLDPRATRPDLPSVAFPYVLYVGQRHGYKNWPLLVRALGAVRGQALGMVCVGGDRPTEEEVRIVGEAGLTTRTFFVQADDATLAGYYAGAVCLAYPSRYEGFGIPLLEALAWGCPVLASTAPALVEVGADAVLYADPDDEAGWTDRLDEIARSSALGPELKARGLARARAFSWEASCRAHAALYDRLMNHRRPSA